MSCHAGVLYGSAFCGGARTHCGAVLSFEASDCPCSAAERLPGKDSIIFAALSVVNPILVVLLVVRYILWGVDCSTAHTWEHTWESIRDLKVCIKKGIVRVLMKQECPI